MPEQRPTPAGDSSQSTLPLTGAARPPTSTLDVLRNAPFRGLWGAGGAFFLGNAMHNMAASWQMIEVSGSAFLAALVQTAAFLPMFLLSLPAGVLADTADRRRLMIGTQTVYTAAALLLALLVVVGHVGPATLLFFTFVLGVCTAVQSPSWNSAVSDTVTRDQLPIALTLIAMAYNGARAVGPALAGLVFSFTGSAVVIGIAALCAVAMMLATYRWPPQPRPKGKLPPERLWGGMLSGLRFVRHSPAVLSHLVRTVAYSAIGSALWALLPVVAQRQLGLGAAGFGLLMACLGGGAVTAGFFVGRLRQRMRLDVLAAGSSVIFAGAMLACALSTWHALVYVSLLFGGAAWMCMLTTLNAGVQMAAPMWVRARATSMHVLCALGSFALGSALWGAASDLAGLTPTLVAAAIFLVASLALARPFPLVVGHEKDVTPANPWEDLFIAHEPGLEDGPVAVEIAYRVQADDAPQFLDAAQLLAVPRRRDGATLWRLYRDLSDPECYCERFIVTSWADYLRQRERVTLADQELEAAARRFQIPGYPIVMRHYVAER
ncbi:MAG: MFS transporter [Burkholderiales bacterium]